jgi:hypothetical protein
LTQHFEYWTWLKELGETANIDNPIPAPIAVEMMIGPALWAQRTRREMGKGS